MNRSYVDFKKAWIRLEICQWFRRFATSVRANALTLVTAIQVFAKGGRIVRKAAAMLYAEV